MTEQITVYGACPKCERTNQPFDTANQDICNECEAKAGTEFMEGRPLPPPPPGL